MYISLCLHSPQPISSLIIIRDSKSDVPRFSRSSRASCTAFCHTSNSRWDSLRLRIFPATTGRLTKVPLTCEYNVVLCPDTVRYLLALHDRGVFCALEVLAVFRKTSLQYRVGVGTWYLLLKLWRWGVRRLWTMTILDQSWNSSYLYLPWSYLYLHPPPGTAALNRCSHLQTIELAQVQGPPLSCPMTVSSAILRLNTCLSFDGRLQDKVETGGESKRWSSRMSWWEGSFWPC